METKTFLNIQGLDEVDPVLIQLEVERIKETLVEYSRSPLREVSSEPLFEHWRPFLYLGNKFDRPFTCKEIHGLIMYLLSHRAHRRRFSDAPRLNEAQNEFLRSTISFAEVIGKPTQIDPLRPR
jgi:hypothetical protein